MIKIILWLLTVVGVIVVIGVILFGGDRIEGYLLGRDAAQHFNRRVELLEEKTSTELTAQERILLLDAYYYLKRHRQMIKLAEFMKTEIRDLPSQPRQILIEMIQEAYRELGHEEKALEFSQEAAE